MPNGNYKAWPHLNSGKTHWKTRMTSAAKLVEGFLESRGIYPECTICDRARGWAEHIAGPKHYNQIWERFLKSEAPIKPQLPNATKVWCVVEGAFRYNYLDGTIHMCRGEPDESSNMLGEVKFTSI